jgi:hypothetical protein
MSRHIGVALSGGGHRASLWGLGALLYLVDVGKSRELGAISSVSGGSISNGVVAHEVDVGEVDPPEFERAVSRLVRHVADTGFFFWGPSTNAYVLSVLAGAAAGVVALIVGIVVVFRDGLTWTAGLTLIAAVVVLSLTARWFERRSEMVDRALAKTHFSGGGRATPLSAVDRSVDHVFCATELQSADHLYLSPRFVSSYALGVGGPAGLRLSTAVQASACLPGVFSPRRLPTAPHKFSSGQVELPAEMVLVDGGVYDNMADQWLGGLADRLRRVPTLPVRARDLDEIVVVNASAATQWTKVRRLWLVLLSELTSLMRVSSVMYQVTTERRRRGLVAEWRAAEQAGHGQRGALVHIAQSPYLVADRFRGSASAPDRAARSEAVLALLGDTAEGRQEWARRADASRNVPTVLRRLGRDVTLDLLEHSYLLAMCNLHILLDYPLASQPVRHRVSRLLVEPPAGRPAGAPAHAAQTPGAP